MTARSTPIRGLDRGGGGATTTDLRRTGLAILGEMPWGSHCYHFYQTPRDLLETLVPCFRLGLEGREYCVWVIHKPLTVAQVRRALERGVPDGDRYLADGSLEIVSSGEWYLKDGALSSKRVMRKWTGKLEEASARGYEGLRVNGDTGWPRRKDWRRFGDYEKTLNESLVQKRMIVLCSYPLAACGAAEVLDVARSHHFAIAKRVGSWEVVEWRSPPTSLDLYDTLTTRERQVLLLAAEGHTNSEIARRLSIGVRTAESHRASLLRKLGLRNQTELVQYAFRRGLLPLEHRRRQATDH